MCCALLSSSWAGSDSSAEAAASSASHLDAVRTLVRSAPFIAETADAERAPPMPVAPVVPAMVASNAGSRIILWNKLSGGSPGARDSKYRLLGLLLGLRGGARSKWPASGVKPRDMGRRDGVLPRVDGPSES